MVLVCSLFVSQHAWSELVAQTTASGSPAAERVFSDSPNVWFEAYSTWAWVSPDGRWAIYAGGTGVRILDLNEKRGAPNRIWPGVSDVSSAAWGANGMLVLAGTSKGKRGWYENGRNGPRLLPLPAQAWPVWSPDGTQLAYAMTSTPESVYVGALGKPRAYPVAGRGITGMSWLPDGRSLLVLADQPQGTAQLVQLELPSGNKKIIAADLDAGPYLSPVAVAPDARHAYVALASAGIPPPERRHEPKANRWLGIYAIDLSSGARQLVVPAPTEGADVMAPSVGGGSLFWTRTRTNTDVVVMPSTGGTAELVMRGGMVPTWRPDGRQIGFCYGDWRWADWAINWDGGAVDVDARGRPTSTLRPIITGYHEDFPPVWSPRGHWIAYHSHRPKAPVPYYDSPGATDDIWLRPAGAPARDSAETRLTDFGWETGSPSWSRDGSRLLFTSYDKAGNPGVNLPFIVSIDTATGRSLSHGRLPMPAEIHNAMSAVWSPVSDEIAVEEDLGGGRHALWILASDRKRARKLTEFALSTYGGLSWTRDGKAIIYPVLTQGRMQLFSIDVQGSQTRQLSHNAANLFQPAVSPDGQLIAATRISHVKEVWRMRLGAP